MRDRRSLRRVVARGPRSFSSRPSKVSSGCRPMEGCPRLSSRSIQRRARSLRARACFRMGTRCCSLSGTRANWDEASIVAHSLTTDERQVLIRGGADAVYASTGHLLYANGNTLYAAPFDPRQLELKGGPVPVVEGISRSDGNGTAQYSVSSTGSIVYIKDLGQETTLAWTDRGGGSPELIGAPRRSYRTPRLSPDGKRLLVLLEGDLWLYDLLRSSWTRLTFTGSIDYPIWTPDGTRVVFSSTEKGSANLYWVPADGSGEAEAMLEPGLERHADSISRDGRWLTFHEHHPTTGTDLWRIRLGGELEAQPYLCNALQ